MEAYRKAIINYTRPVCFDYQDAKYQYGCRGSAVCVSYSDHYFVITAKHVLKGTRPKDVLIGYSAGAPTFLPIEDAFTISTEENDDTDHQDIAFLKVWKPELDLDRFDSGLFFPLTSNRAVKVGDSSKFFAVGWPDECNYMDYEEQKLYHQVAVIPVRLSQVKVSTLIHECEILNSGPLKSTSGLSGGAVFSLNPTAESAADVRLEGIIIRGGVQAKRLRIISWKWLERILFDSCARSALSQ